ncbi:MULTISPECIES: hypothetical protein [Micrococcaceae]|nr:MULTISPECIES: hypothetical protein [unclassified Arthrobacter]MDT0195743.1 hypothetical protein [Arthrobacter sp. AB6]
MSTDDEKDPPVPADVEGKIPKKVHDKPGADDDKSRAEEPQG